VVAEVRAACRTADGHDPLDEAAELMLKHHGLSGAALWLAGDHGFALLHDGALELAVHPDARRHGAGAALLEAVLADPVAAGAVLEAWAHGNHPAAARLAAGHGFTRTRDLWVMRARLDHVEVPEAAGVTIRGYRPEDAAEVLRVNAAAFAHHPEQGSMDAAELAERMAEPWFDPAGLLVADDGDGLLGFHWTKRHLVTDGPDHGEVYVVGIDPAAQGRGLGRTLTAAGLAHLVAQGLHDVVLYVESDNAPALALYRGLGFTHADADTHVRWTRPADAASAEVTPARP
jgi:mycothiol synthase